MKHEEIRHKNIFENCTCVSENPEKKFDIIETVPNFLSLSCESIFKPETEFRNKEMKYKFEELKRQMIFHIYKYL